MREGRGRNADQGLSRPCSQQASPALLSCRPPATIPRRPRNPAYPVTHCHATCFLPTAALAILFPPRRHPCFLCSGLRHVLRYRMLYSSALPARLHAA